jgi:glutamate 5-kinase
LPAGIRAVVGQFNIGDPVLCTDPDGREIARGLVAYSAQDVTRICGLSTRQIEAVLGYTNGGEVIHRDDLVVLAEPSADPSADTSADRSAG